MIRPVLSLLAAILTVSASSSCQADTFTTFDLSGNVMHGYTSGQITGSVSGTLTIDVTTGVVTAIDITGTTTSDDYLGASSTTYSTVTGQGPLVTDFNGMLITLYTVQAAIPGGGLSLDFDTPSLTGYMGGPLCTEAHSCRIIFSGFGFDHNDGVVIHEATVQPEFAPVPEPSTLVLLCSGVLGTAGKIRKRFA